MPKSNVVEHIGSAQQLHNKLAANGKRLTAPMLSILSMLGLVEIVEKITPDGGRGKKANLLKVKSKTVQLDITEYNGPITVVLRGKKKLAAEAAAAAALAEETTKTEPATVTDILTGDDTAPADTTLNSSDPEVLGSTESEPVAQAA